LNAEQAVASPEKAEHSLWSRIKVPAILLIIGLNIIWFGGNAVVDLWQTVGPTKQFTGAITAHDTFFTQGENSQQFWRLTIGGNRQSLTFDVPQHVYDSTQVGQQGTAVFDAHGLLGHDEGLRSMTADDKSVLHIDETNRAIDSLLILGVVCTVGGLAIKWIVSRSRHRRARAAPSAVTK